MTDARGITLGLGGRWRRRFGMAPCPVCQPEQRGDRNALTLSDAADGRLLAHCKKLGCDFTDIIAALGFTGGGYEPPNPYALAARDAEAQAEQRRALERCKRIWDRARPLVGTEGEAYFQRRGITVPLPNCLRWRSDILHTPSGRWVSAVVAKVEPTGGLHRTFLLPDGKRDKLMLGPCSGGSVRLTEEIGPLLIGEGIESTLSALQLLGRPEVSAWATLSTSGMRGVVLPEAVGELIIAVDGDAPGRAAGADLAERAVALGWRVSVADPSDGQDWNDQLIHKVAS